MPRMLTQAHTLKEWIREANPIEAVIGETLQLRRNGYDLVGAHHTHGSTSGTSLHVDPDQGLYYCFNCGEGGTVFDWIMSLQSCTFAEALRYLAQRAHIPLPDWTDEERARHEQVWQDGQIIKRIFRAAADYYHAQLTPEWHVWCQEQWGLTAETLQRFQVGFAPVSQKALWSHLREDGFSPQELMKSGLFVLVNGEFLDFYQGRIIFPYWSALPSNSHGGEVVYFIGRQTEQTPEVDWEQGKYKKLLTRREKHPYVSKAVSNRYFFGEYALQQARDGDLLITEGIADALAALQVGIPCLSPGTVTFREADLPRLTHRARIARRVIIINDAEANQAGERGALKTAVHLFRQGVDARIGTLPRPEGVEKVDIADYLKTHGREEFCQIMAEAKPILDVHLDRVRQAAITDKIKAAEDMYPLVLPLSGVQRDLAARALQKAFGGAKVISLGTIRKAVSTAAPEPSLSADGTAAEDEAADERAIEGPRPQARVAASVVKLLDESPPMLTRPLRLIDGQAYAATWLWTETTVTEVEKNGEIITLTEPRVTRACRLFVVQDDGTVFGEGGDKGMDDLALDVFGLGPSHPDEMIWSSSGVKAYRSGRRPDHAETFRWVREVFDHFMDFRGSLAPQDVMCELSACLVLMTWVADAFTVLPYPWTTAPGPDSGKSKWGLCWAKAGYLGYATTMGGDVRCASRPGGGWGIDPV
jgi:DNA primase catalytic core